VHALSLFKALRFNTNLRRLKICLDRDMHLDAPLEESFEIALQNVLLEHNHILQSVAVLDENRDKYPLGATIKHKLQLNASNLPALLHGNSSYEATSSSKKQHQLDYINAMIDSKDSLDVLFYALSSQPHLLLDARFPEPCMSESNSLIDTDSESDDDSTAHWGKFVIKRKSAVSIAKQKILGLFHV
jgi:hypothetical protein